MMDGRFWRLLLRAFPDRWRTRHERELLRFWACQAEEPRYRGAAGRLRFTLGRLYEVTTTATRVRWRSWRERSRRRRWEEGTMQTTLRDLLYARRALSTAPLFTVLAVSTLALGIGAITAVYSVVSAVVLQPLPYPEPDRLVDVPRTTVEGQTRAISWPDFRDWRDRSGDFLALAGYAEAEGTFEWDAGAEAVTGAIVSRDFFAVMGISPALGRTFSEEEDRFGGPDAVVLGHGMWLDRFGADPAIVGRTVPIDGEQIPVVGVMPPDFAAPQPETRFWRPLQEDRLLARAGLPTGTRSLSFITGVGRLSPGTRVADGQEHLRTVVTAVDDEIGRDPDRRAAPVLVPLLEARVGDVESTLFVLLAAAALVLLVASANVAALGVSRATAREHELVVRTALGAGRLRLVRQLLTEAAVLASIAGLGGVVVTAGLQRLLVTLAPPGIPRLGEVGLSTNTLAVAAVASVVSGLVLGLIPAARAVRGVGRTSLNGRRGSSTGRSALRPQRALVAFQVAASVILLSGAVLLARSYARLTAVELGFDTGGTVLATVQPNEDRYPTPEAVDAFYGELLAAVRAIPGVATASTSYSPPLSGNNFRTSVTPEGVEVDEEDAVMVETIIVRDGYFEANGIPVVAGRAFDGTERIGEPPVAMVSRSMAELFWPGADPIGRRFDFTGGMRGSVDSFDEVYFPEEPFTVVGVAGDVRPDGHATDWALAYYRPHAQITWPFQYLVVRTHANAPALAPAIREAVWGLDPSIPVRTVRTMESYLSESIAPPRFRMLLVGGFAAITCLLAMVGLYAVMALAVARRRREMGIRLALGARRETVVRGVLAQGMRLALLGGAVGLVVAWFASRTLTSMLFELEPTDPLAYGVVCGLVGGVALLACWGPARRAAWVDPAEALREE